MSLQALIDAIDQGDEKTAGRLLDDSAELAGARDPRGLSLILRALYRRQAAIAEILAARRAGELDLHEAAALGRTEAARALLEAREPVSSRSADGFTPLHYAAFFARPQVAELLVEHGAEADAVADNPSRVRPLHSAAANGSVEISRLLLAAGADPDAQQQAGYTALMSAALHGNRELVELLLEHGAETSVSSEDGRTAADFAAENGHDELARRLRRQGALRDRLD